MPDNLSLWRLVEKTPTEHVKPITGKSYSGNSPKPHYLVQKATEVFGPVGIGWGFFIEERIEDGALIEPGFYERMHIAKVKVWYVWEGKQGAVEHIGGTQFSGKRKNGAIFTDEDAPKKSVTDALVKALSMIGFAGDIFMGRYDDAKYVQELRHEEREAKQLNETEARHEPPQAREPAVSSEAIRWSRNLKGNTKLVDLERYVGQPEYLEAVRAMNNTDKQYLRMTYSQVKQGLAKVVEVGEDG